MRGIPFLMVLPTALLFLVGAALAAEATRPAGGEVLYNGIVLPQEWPPKLEAAPADPVTPYYLVSPPKRIPIDVGRQLFVDEFLIESTTLARTCHQAEYYPGNPVLESGAYSGGMWHDPADGRIKFWQGGRLTYSEDGIHWQGGETVLRDKMHSSAIWINPDATDPNKRYVAIYSVTFDPPGHCHYWYNYSADGVHWGERRDTHGDCGDRSSAFYNPFRKVWVYSIRHGWVGPRSRRYWEMRDLDAGPYWSNNAVHAPVNYAPYWIGADSADIRRPEVVDTEWSVRGFGLSPRPGVECQLYNLDCLAYESVMLGLFTVWRGQPAGRQKPNDVCVGYSRDGWSWSRPDRRTLYPMHGSFTENGDFRNTQSICGGCLVMGDRLFLYTGRPGTRLGVLRRDGFVSMDAGGDGGELVTRPVTFSGKRMFVNVEAPQGELRVAVLDEAGQTIPGFGRDDCQPIRANKTLQPVSWRGGNDLSALAGKPVRFRFELTNGKLYAFWVSPDSSGASKGFSGAGGPGFTAATDTVGGANYEKVTPSPAAGTAPTPRLWPLEGTYTGGVTIRVEVPLYTAVEGSAIRYTTDGSDPTDKSPLYEKPFTLRQAGKATVKARVFKASLAPSAVTEGSFQVKEDAKAPHCFDAGPKGDLPGGTKDVTVQVRTGESAVCRYATEPDVPFEQMIGRLKAEGRSMTEAVADLPGGTLHTAVIDGLSDGDTRRFYFKARDVYGNTTEKDVEIAVTVNPDKPLPFEWRMEAEAGKLDAPMRVGTQIDAIEGKYITSDAKDEGAATYRFSVPRDGKYVVWVRALGRKSEDSFYVSVDGNEDIFDLLEEEPPQKPDWQRCVVNGRDAQHPFALNPRIFNLNAGEHTLLIRGREPAGMIDWIIVTNDLEARK